MPLDTWLLRDLRALVEDALLSPEAPLGRYLDLAVVRSLWTRFHKRRDTRPGRQLWRLVNLAVWHEIHWPSGRLADVPGSDAIGELFVERHPD